jgi:heme-degrading monooxygenase HmoA
LVPPCDFAEDIPAWALRSRLLLFGILQSSDAVPAQVFTEQSNRETVMIAVIFEFLPHEGRASEYFDIAASLRTHLDGIDGFISIERFESVSAKGKFLSLSFWRDEESVRVWRNLEVHRLAQAKGRGGVFSDYRLRVATVLRDYGMKEREQAPGDSRSTHG